MNTLAIQTEPKLDTKKEKWFSSKIMKSIKKTAQAAMMVLWLSSCSNSLDNPWVNDEISKITPDVSLINKEVASNKQEFNEKFLKIVWAETPKLETKIVVESSDNLPDNNNWITYLWNNWVYTVKLNEKATSIESQNLFLDENLYRESYIIPNEIWSIKYDKFLVDNWYIEPQTSYQVKDPILNINVPYSTLSKTKNKQRQTLVELDRNRELTEVAWDLNSIKTLVSKLDWKTVDPMILALRMMDTKISTEENTQYNLINQINQKIFKQVFWLEYNKESLTSLAYTLNDIRSSWKIWIELFYYEAAFRYYQELLEKHFYAEVAKISEDQADDLIASNIFEDKNFSTKQQSMSNNSTRFDYIIKNNNYLPKIDWPFVDYVDKKQSNDSIVDALITPKDNKNDDLWLNTSQNLNT